MFRRIMFTTVKGKMTAKKGKRNRREQAAEVASVTTGIASPKSRRRLDC